MAPIDTSRLINSAMEAPLSTSIPQCPEGEWLSSVATVNSPADIEKWFRQGKDKNGNEYTVLSIPISIDSQEPKTALRRDKIIVYLDEFLTFDSNGGLSTAEGDNVRLGQLFDACGMNGAGASIASLPGKGPFLAIVKQAPSDRTDPESDKRARVVRVARRK